MFTSLKAVAYQVPDLAQARRWYAALLGAEPIFETPFAVVFKVGDTLLTLSPSDPAVAAPSTLAYWGVDDTDAAHERLLSLGAVSRGGVINSALGNRMAIVVDPFGNALGLSSPPVKTGSRSLREQPSDSALGVTLFRAMAAREPHEEIRGGDTLAEKFLPEQFRPLLENPAASQWMRNKVPGSYEFFLARTAFFDAAFREALAAGLPQIVFLGAGYDSRPYRFRDLNSATRVFELDIESTQRRKRQVLEGAGIAVPDEVRFVPIDFSRDDLGQTLRAAGFDPALDTLFIWEGVLYYLPIEAVDRTLECVRSLSSPASTLAFDYLLDAPDMDTRYGVAEAKQAMRETYHAEPIRTAIQEDTIESFLAQRGFRLLDHLTPEDMERRYLTLNDGSSAGKVLARFCLVRAAI